MNKKLVILLIFTIVFLLSCSLLTTPTQQVQQEQPINPQTAAARTREFDLAVQTALAGNTGGGGGVVIPTINQPVVPSATFTSSVPMISVSVDTNCRTGPSTAYEAISYLLVGRTSEVTAKYQNGSWWVIKDPVNPGIKCWAWGQYATVSGNWQALPEATQPPTPTVGLAITIDGNVTNSNYTGACPVTLGFTWNINSTLPINMNYAIISSKFMLGIVQNTSFGPGTKTFSYNQSYDATGAYWERFQINSPLSINEQVDVNIFCT